MGLGTLSSSLRSLTLSLTPSPILSSSLIPSLPRPYLPIISRQRFVLVADPRNCVPAISLRSPYLPAISQLSTISQEGFVLVTDPLSGMKTSNPIKASFAMSTVLTLLPPLQYP